MAEAVIRLRNLTKVYKLPGFLKSKEIRGIEDLSFEVKEGEIFGLLGLNGSGKTTTLRCLVGLLKPTSGLAEVFGKSAYQDARIRSELGYLPENLSFSPHLSAGEILTLFARLDRPKFPTPSVIHSRIQEVLEVVGLSQMAKRATRTYSKGMNQRLGIAQAILHHPSILVLDEPASGLDPLGIVEMRELFLKLNRDFRITVLFSSHSIGEVEKVSHRVAIVARNRLNRVLEKSQWQNSGKTLEDCFLEEVRI